MFLMSEVPRAARRPASLLFLMTLLQVIALSRFQSGQTVRSGRDSLLLAARRPALSKWTSGTK